MRHALSFVATAAVVLGSFAAALPARAQNGAGERSYLQRRVSTPLSALELTVGSGYAQGFGTLQPGLAMPRVAKAGIGVDASVGYRIEPAFAVSFGVQYQELQAERDDGVRGFAWNIALQYHLAPEVRLDPWVELGAGYRMLWLVPSGPATNTLLHGPQLVRLRAGLDLRVSPGVALGPLIGVDATMFTFRDDTTFTVVSDPTVSMFVFAGLQGRIDIGVMRPSQEEARKSSRPVAAGSAALRSSPAPDAPRTRDEGDPAARAASGTPGPSRRAFVGASTTASPGCP